MFRVVLEVPGLYTSWSGICHLHCPHAVSPGNHSHCRVVYVAFTSGSGLGLLLLILRLRVGFWVAVASFQVGVKRGNTRVGILAHIKCTQVV